MRWSEEGGPLTENRDRRIETLRELSAAVLRVNASLDLTTVLQEVVDRARALTGARYGVVTTVDEAGQVHDFVSSGFTPEEHRQLAAWPDGPRLFEHFRDLDGPMRLADLPAFVRSLGFFLRVDKLEDLPGHADALPQRARGQLLPRREGGRA